MSSKSKIPNPKTSVFSEDCPVERYSGAMCPTVPRTAVVTCESLLSNSLARPKSPTTDSKFSSSKIFAAFTSLWIIFGLHCSCKYNSPRAAPRAMCMRLFQSKDGFSRPVSVQENQYHVKRRNLLLDLIFVWKERNHASNAIWYSTTNEIFLGNQSLTYWISSPKWIAIIYVNAKIELKKSPSA